MVVEIKGYGKIMAGKKLLNLISYICDNASELQEINGQNVLSERFKSIGDSIYSELKKSGYYDYKGVNNG